MRFIVMEQKLRKPKPTTLTARAKTVVYNGTVWLGTQALQVPAKQAVLVLLAAHAARPWALTTLQTAWGSLPRSAWRLRLSCAKARMRGAGARAARRPDMRQPCEPSASWRERSG